MESHTREKHDFIINHSMFFVNYTVPLVLYFSMTRTSLRNARVIKTNSRNFEWNINKGN